MLIFIHYYHKQIAIKFTKYKMTFKKFDCLKLLFCNLALLTVLRRTTYRLAHFKNLYLRMKRAA
jgi:hypothetical protein